MIFDLGHLKVAFHWSRGHPLSKFNDIPVIFVTPGNCVLEFKSNQILNLLVNIIYLEDKNKP